MPRIQRLLPALLCLTASAAFADVTVTELKDRVRVEIDGKLFTELLHEKVPHVSYWPIIGPGGVKMTRSWPLAEAPDEEHDHPHHRSLWFAHGLVDGIDYWSEATTFGRRPPKHPVGWIMHDKVLKVQSGKESGEVVSSLNWIHPEGGIPVTSTQRLVVYDLGEEDRQFDFEIVIKAGDKDVEFQETKEGTTAIRIAESMRARQPKGKTAEGRIVNSEGHQNADAWGKEAKWVAMSGPIEGKPYTIAMLDHPSNFRHPTRWHARDYGLFAANPFGGAQMDKSLPQGAGNHKLKAGETLTLKYRFLLQQGDANPAKINERFAAYAAGKAK